MKYSTFLYYQRMTTIKAHTHNADMPMVDAKSRPFLINQQISNMFNTGHPQTLRESMINLANLMVQ